MKIVWHPLVAIMAAILIGAFPPRSHATADRLTPVVLFPAFHFTKLTVLVDRQSVAPECPASGSFEDWYQNDAPGTAFDQVCRDKLLTFVVARDASSSWHWRFTNQPGVTVEFKDFGKTHSAPFYEPLYAFLEANGYTRDVNIQVAGYDSRLTPDLGGFLARTKALIERTYTRNGNTPVHLVGHSNGPIYAQYLLTHTTQAWKNRYIHGFTPIAGNFPGQGLLYPVLFTGINTIDFSFPSTAANALSSATMYQTHPTTYMSAASPAVFGRREVVVKTMQAPRAYTPEDFDMLLRDAGLGTARALAQRYVGFLKFRTPRYFPNVDVYGEKGSGLTTEVGVQLRDLSVGQVLDPATAKFFTRGGDSNQEDITNNALRAWQAMPCFHFELNDNPGVGHFSLPSDAEVLQRLLIHLRQARSRCS